MKNLTSLLLSGCLAIATASCDTVSKTSAPAPDSTATTTTDVNKPTAETNQNDATGEMRRKQLNSDIRAREQRTEAVGDKSNKADGDLESQVRSKLEANLPASALAVDAKDGAVTVTGTVVDDKQLQKVEPLTKQISGVKSVAVKATVNTGAKPAAPNPEASVPIKDQTNAR